MELNGIGILITLLLFNPQKLKMNIGMKKVIGLMHNLQDPMVQLLLNGINLMEIN